MFNTDIDNDVFDINIVLSVLTIYHRLSSYIYKLCFTLNT